jgi:hypothetical protein
MLKGNLSTRPFYAERAVSLVVVLATVLGIGLTVFNVVSIYHLNGLRTKQKVEQDKNLAEAARINAEATRLRGTIDRANLLVLAGQTREANGLIDQRTFSWTDFFSLLEDTMPIDARLMSVAPRVERGVFNIVMSVNVKDLNELPTLIDAVLARKAFADLFVTGQQGNEDGTLTATLEGQYLAAGAPGTRTVVRSGGRR